MTTTTGDRTKTWGASALGAHLVDGGLEVAVLAAHAQALELCLLDPDPTAENGWRERRIPMQGPHYGIWRVFVPDVQAGQHYGLRAHGTWDPAAGLRYNPNKLLLDPYARAVEGELDLGPEVLGHEVDEHGAGDPDGAMSTLDSLGHVPVGVVVDSGFTPRIERPNVPWTDTVLYEAHVRGLTKLLPGVPEHLRGTYAGLAHPATIEHLRSLGVTTIELLPIQAFTSEPHLVETDLTNYWGYSTLGFFAPHAAYATAAARASGPTAVLDEVKGMVHLLHEAGIEVVLDVVYNHTCEGGTPGPQLAWRGLDNTTYYLHDGGSPARYADVTGTGNTLDFRRTRVIQMALDSLRYWAQEIGVDGFRFDLAVTLGRGHDGFTPHHPFLTAMRTDPVLGDLKLIAEPWDVGPGGWRTGQFPAPIAEWNDRFRGAVREFWLTDADHASHGRVGHGVRELATRLAGSVDLFGYGDPPLVRGSVASINFVTAHDGFTMADLTRYSHKHNEANGEDNRDGTDDNRSWNHGLEGTGGVDDMSQQTDSLRRRSHRNLLAMLLLSAGTPMITAGDEFARTQGGNNNAYCQDNEISWVDWNLDEHGWALLATTSYLVAQRKALRALRTDRFYRGRPFPEAPDGGADLTWHTVGGEPFTDGRWHDPHERALQMVRRCPDPGEPAVLMVLNGSLDALEVKLADSGTESWVLLWDSTWEHPDERYTANEDDEPGVTIEPLSVRLYASSTTV